LERCIWGDQGAEGADEGKLGERQSVSYRKENPAGKKGEERVTAAMVTCISDRVLKI